MNVLGHVWLLFLVLYLTSVVLYHILRDDAFLPGVALDGFGRVRHDLRNDDPRRELVHHVVVPGEQQHQPIPRACVF